MKLKTHIQLLALLVAISSCGTARYFQQTADNVDFGKYKTFAFLPRTDTAEFSLYNSGIVQENTVKDISGEMERRGFKLDAENPDLLILPHFMFERKHQTVYDPVYPNYDYWYPGFYVNPWFGYYFPGYVGISKIDGAGIRQIDYTEGTMVIDVIENADGHRLIWRGWSNDRINPNTFTHEVGYYINHIFEKFPVEEKESK